MKVVKYILSFLILLILQIFNLNSFAYAYSYKELGVLFVENSEQSNSDFSESCFKENNIFEKSFFEVVPCRSISLFDGYAELVEGWKKLSDLGADDVLKRNTEALEYLANGRSDKILLEVEELLGGHSKARHGSQLTMTEMEQRVLGTHPTMPQSRSALKFDSDAIHEDAVNTAFQNYKTTIDEHFKTSDDYLELDFDYGSKIGEGYTNTGSRSNPVSSKVETSKVRVAFKRDINSPNRYILDSAYPLYE